MNRTLLLMLLNVTFGSIALSQEFEWSKKAGSWAYDYGYGITTDDSGNVYVAGKFEKEANFSGTILPWKGNHDIFVAKYNPAGALIWVRSAGGYSGDYAQCITTDNSFIYIAGEIQGTGTITFFGSSITLTPKGDNDIFIAKYDLNGTLIWAKQAGDLYDDNAYGISTDNSGNIYICGYYTTSATFDGSTISGFGGRDIFVAKYDSDGNHVWVRRAGGNGNDEAKSIKVDASGNAYICGKFKSSAKFEGKTVKSNGNNDMFIAKYFSNGNLAWVKRGGSRGDDVAWSLTLDNSDKIFVTGEFHSTAKFDTKQITSSGSADVFVVRYNASGVAEWAIKAGGDLADRAKGIGTDGEKIFITGQFGSTASFGTINKTAADSSDIFFTALSNNGNFLWTSTVNGSPDSIETLGFESGNAICAEQNGNVYATGSILNGGVFGNTSLAPYKRTDIFITKLSPLGDTTPIADTTIIVDTTWASAARIEIIPAGSSWKYLDNGTNQGTAWKGISFNDSTWKTGNAEFGYGDGDETTVISFGPDSLKKYITTYFRKTFELTDTSGIIGLELSLIRDDGAVVYINGVEVIRDNMPAGTIYFSTAASGAISKNESVYRIYKISSASLQNGTNIIAVEIHQNWGNTLDMSFNLKLSKLYYIDEHDGLATDTISNTSNATELIVSGSSWKYLDNGTNQGNLWQSSTFDDSEWKTGNAEFGYGDGDETTVVSFGTMSTKKFITTYFRNTFNIVNSSSISALELGLIRDDGAVVYINGVEVYRNNMPSGTIYYNTLASSAIDEEDESSYLLKILSPSFLINGTNFIAVEVHQSQASSSDLSFNLKLSISSENTSGTSLFIAENSNWKYLDSGLDQGTSWRDNFYSDTSWKSGNAEFGYGDGDENTVISYGPSSSDKFVTTYFRKTFNVVNISSVTGLELSIIRDDGAVVYINGIEVYRNNMPSGAIYYNTLASSPVGSEESEYQVKILSPSALVNGTNVISVEVHQAETNSSDLSFNLMLRPIKSSKMAFEENAIGLISFNGLVKESQVHLFWVTAPEVNVEHFLIERSMDKENFSLVGKVLGEENSANQNSYSFIDSTLIPLTGNQNGLLFYRLNITDEDGIATYSQIIEVAVEPLIILRESSGSFSFNVYPNPVKQSLMVNYSGIDSRRFILTLYDFSGKTIIETKIEDQITGIDVSSFVSGIYMLCVKNDDEIIYSGKIMIQN